ncbi:hypothetical protein PYCCODRAFT_5662 [Trametes coccinea BRFM310]|uniref:Uncharacterized protein n=1 Tax=Trametes coccinea (strain BRFM310) TaxID=1353009 RepID=A0A1Y2J5S9_TRAC3|nr:hypothetical protein PYCCODRAFT_5662 [Trametes coccinea BRFM310]
MTRCYLRYRRCAIAIDAFAIQHQVPAVYSVHVRPAYVHTHAHSWQALEHLSRTHEPSRCDRPLALGLRGSLHPPDRTRRPSCVGLGAPTHHSASLINENEETAILILRAELATHEWPPGTAAGVQAIYSLNSLAGLTRICESKRMMNAATDTRGRSARRPLPQRREQNMPDASSLHSGRPLVP